MLLLGASCKASPQLQLPQQQPQSLLALVQYTSLPLLLRARLVQQSVAASLLKLGMEAVTSQLALPMQLTHGGGSNTAPDAAAAAAAAVLRC
jgi:hypothetical protein